MTAGDLVYLQTPWTIAAVDGRGGQKLWQTNLVDTTSPLEESWPLVPTRLIVTEKRLFVRRFGKGSTELVAIGRTNGKIQWVRSFAGQGEMISDPVITGGRLVALTSEQRPRGEQIYVAQFDANNGDELSREPLVQLRDSWLVYHACGLVVDNGRLLATLGGAVLSFDVEGDVHWQRRQTWLSPMLDPAWQRSQSTAPLVAKIDERRFALVTQPGAPLVECIDPQTGRRLWRHVDIGVRSVLGKSGSAFIVETDRGLLALDVATGRALWTHRSASVTPAYLCGKSNILAIKQVVSSDNKQIDAKLVWLDGKTGRVQATAATGLTAKSERPMSIGPLVAHNGSLLITTGDKGDARTRQIVRLVPSGQPADIPPKVAAVP